MESVLMVEISVILPVYNIEDYLSECLESISNQTFEDIEIICIDDGSTDKSLEILKEHSNRDSRIRIIEQENQGAGAARNKALEYAAGKYVYFIDGDDYLELTALEELHDLSIRKGTDFIIFQISNFNDKTKEIIDDDYYNMPHLKEAVGENTFCYEDISKIALDLCVCPPGCFFKRELIKDIRFPEGLLFEDNVFFTHALFKAEKVYFYDKFLYNRRKREDSTTTPITVKSLDTIEISNLLIDLCVRFNHEKHKKELYYRIFNNIYNIFKNADSSQKDELFEKIKKDYLESKDKWENDDYFKDKLNPKYKHMFKCAIKSKNANKFESCVESYNKERKIKRLMDKIL